MKRFNATWYINSSIISQSHWLGNTSGTGSSVSTNVMLINKYKLIDPLTVHQINFEVKKSFSACFKKF
jgi:hypothetical protein